MLKCKCCKKSNFGAMLVETKSTPIMMSNGEPVKVLAEQETIETVVNITYCMTCKKDIDPEKDLYELETCQACGNEFDEVDANGLCAECAKKRKELDGMSKDDLLLLLLKQQMSTGKVAVGTKTKGKNKKSEALEEEPVAEVKEKQKVEKVEKKTKEITKDEELNDVAASADESVDLNMDVDEDIDILDAIDNVDINLGTYDDNDNEIF